MNGKKVDAQNFYQGTVTGDEQEIKLEKEYRKNNSYYLEWKESVDINTICIKGKRPEIGNEKFILEYYLCDDSEDVELIWDMDHVKDENRNGVIKHTIKCRRKSEYFPWTMTKY